MKLDLLQTKIRGAGLAVGDMENLLSLQYLSPMYPPGIYEDAVLFLKQAEHELQQAARDLKNQYRALHNQTINGSAFGSCRAASSCATSCAGGCSISGTGR